MHRTLEDQKERVKRIKEGMTEMRATVYRKCVALMEYDLTDDTARAALPRLKTYSIKNREIAPPIRSSLKAAQLYHLERTGILSTYIDREQLDSFWRATQIEVTGTDDIDAEVQERWNDFNVMHPLQMLQSLQADAVKAILGVNDDELRDHLGHALNPLSFPTRLVVAKAFDDEKAVELIEEQLKDFFRRRDEP